jgi:hypothetical protein
MFQNSQTPLPTTSFFDAFVKYVLSFALCSFQRLFSSNLFMQVDLSYSDIVLRSLIESLEQSNQSQPNPPPFLNLHCIQLPLFFLPNYYQ